MWGTIQMKQECLRKIELRSGGVAVTYCILPLNHEGRCVAAPFIEAAYADEKKLPSSPIK